MALWRFSQKHTLAFDYRTNLRTVRGGMLKSVQREVVFLWSVCLLTLDALSPFLALPSSFLTYATGTLCLSQFVLVVDVTAQLGSPSMHLSVPVAHIIHMFMARQELLGSQLPSPSCAVYSSLTVVLFPPGNL